MTASRRLCVLGFYLQHQIGCGGTRIEPGVTSANGLLFMEFDGERWRPSGSSRMGTPLCGEPFCL